MQLFWKSALIMASRYPRERAEVDRKKRRAADTTKSERIGAILSEGGVLVYSVIMGICKSDNISIIVLTISLNFQGDSGGPMSHLVNGRYELLGDSSWGPSCQTALPIVYGNVRST
jgi:hypothetical protein